MGGNDAGGAVLDLGVDVEDMNLSLRPPLLLVEVSHHLLDLGQGLLQLLAVGVVRVGPPRMLQDVVQQQGDARQSLHRSDHQLCQGLSGALGSPLAFLQKCVEPGILLVDLLNLVLCVLKEVHERRIGFKQIFCVFKDYCANLCTLCPTIFGFD